MKHKQYSIALRIKKVLLSMTLGLSLVFGLLIFLLMYVIEDQIFINLLHAEQDHFNQQTGQQINSWKPANRYMKLVVNKQNLSEEFQNVVTEKLGVYEFFQDGSAFFILHGKKQFAENMQKSSYYITYDVSELLAVRHSRTTLVTTVIIVTLLVMLIAIWVAIRLSKKSLAPLKKLTDDLQSQDLSELPEGFSQLFVGDEVGILATQLEEAIKRAQSASQREFEFNRGVSHELRSPIQVALNSVELLELTQIELKDNKVIQRLKRSINQMEQISEAFLWLASNRSVEHEITNPSDVLQESINGYMKQHPNKQINFMNHVSQKLQIRTPQSVFIVIIDNLLRNAIQHGSDDEIQVILCEDNILITNSHSANPALNNQSKTGGYGVGLMIVERICQRLDWKLSMQSNNDSFVSAKITMNNHR
jgi:signal transduction histidine kinase